MRLCDALHDTQDVSDALWTELAAEFSDEQLLELIYTAGMYHAVSFLTNALRLEREPFGERFPRAEAAD